MRHFSGAGIKLTGPMGTAAALVLAKAFGVFRDSPTHALIARGRSNTTDPVSDEAIEKLL